MLKKNQSVEKVLAIVETMARARGAMRLQDLATAVGLPASTVLRFLATLADADYVMQDADTLRYALTFKFCHIADLISSQLNIRDTVHPYLETLADRCGESSSLAVEQDGMVVYVDVVDGPDSMLQTLQRIGKRAPLHSTGVGKTLLLDRDPHGISRLIAERGLERLTPKTITTREALDAELERCRRRGYALDDEECEQGVRCVAAPLRDYKGRIVGSISVSGPVARLSRQKMALVTRAVLENAVELSRKLGYEPE